MSALAEVISKKPVDKNDIMNMTISTVSGGT